MSTIADVRIEYSDRGWERARTRLDRLNSGIDKSAKLVKGMSVAVAGAASVWALATKKAIDFADAIDKQSKIAGVSVERFQSLTYAANLYGISQEQLTDGLKDLNKNIGDGNEVFNELGVSLINANGKIRSTEDILDDVSDALSRVESPAKRAAFAARAMGEAGQRMATLLSEGSEAIGVMEQKARDLGIVLSKETVDGAAQASDQLSTLATIVKVNLTNALLTATPQITAIVEELTSDPEGMREFAENIASIAVFLAEAAGAAVKFTNVISRAIKRRWEDADQLEAFINKEVATLEKWKTALARDDWYDTSLSDTKLKNDIDELTAKIENYRFQLDLLRNPSPLDEVGGSDIDTSKLTNPTPTTTPQTVAPSGVIEQITAEEQAILKSIDYQKEFYEEYMQWRSDEYQKHVDMANDIGAAYLEEEKARKEEEAAVALNYVNQMGESLAGYFAATGEDSDRQKDRFIANMKAMVIEALLFQAIAGLSGGALQVGSSGGLQMTSNAKGGVFHGKTNYNASNTMSEQGAEAVMPLMRDSQGRQGVIVAGGESSGGGQVINLTQQIKVESPNADPQQVAMQVTAIARKEAENVYNKNASKVGGRR